MKRRHRRTAWTLFRSLLDADIVRLRADADGKRIEVSEELQAGFSLNQTLALFLVEALTLFEEESPTYAVDVLSLCESILEDPWHVLSRQVDKLKTDKMNELKAAGVEYEERMVELDKIDYPRPHAELLYGAYDGFAVHHPWVRKDNIRPKSIARDMYERFASFSEYVKLYGLERSEGVLLRYLSQCYKLLLQTVPRERQTEEINDILDYLRELLRTADSSLLDEWELMADPERMRRLAKAAEESDEALAREQESARPDITTDRTSFERMVRNVVFHLVRALARKDYEEAAALAWPAESGDESRFPADVLEQAMAPYFEEYGELRTDVEARHRRNARIDTTDPASWTIEQNLLDAEDVTDWLLTCRADLALSRETQRAVIRLDAIGPIAV
jgi:hypothetical protein